ncbi:hypothetical protein DXG03_002175 [Asterophora parasitica]|uniref:Uncharacterized protein n=1 Tax=Asterophora parasitica TaxID=117018 RepID=A0A9P7KDQ6_9AGAR|nr:hypothetical protein DXG03_002175 [Asterophora parasitica]
METFKDDGREGGTIVVLGGKVLVIDVEFFVSREDPLKPIITVSSVKTQYAITDSEGASNSGGSTSLDAFLRTSIENFCVEVHKPEDVRNLEHAARLGGSILDHLRYLVMLDRLAARKVKEGDGLKWFLDLDELGPIVEAFAKNEAEMVASSLALAHAPLDIFLLRSHALPLPYLTSPSISFLVYLSPLAYLTLLRRPAGPTAIQDDQKLPQFDISLATLRRNISSIPQGVALVTLSLNAAHSGQVFPATMAMPTFTARPTFPLVPQGSDLEHVFPKTVGQSNSITLSGDPGQYTWMLDFTNGGKNLGIVMSQSRMREIELVVNPLGGIDTLNTVTMMSFGTGSWVDLLLNSEASVSPERYTALYVVREQCWLNEILSGCQWFAEGLTNTKDELPDEKPATEEELQAVLDGLF